MTRGLGRHPAPDERDHNYLTRQLVGRRSLRTLRPYRYWTPRITLDQGRYPRCVGYRWKTLLVNSPVPRPAEEPPTADAIYSAAQRLDSWPGEDYDGTSTRAGARACVAAGKIREYRWVFTMDDLFNWLDAYGPVIVGTEWYAGMSRPDEKGFIHPTGGYQGGHCHGITGYNLAERKLRQHNNWGLDWGDNGKSWISFDEFEYLFLERGGEVCTPTEVLTA